MKMLYIYLTGYILWAILKDTSIVLFVTQYRLRTLHKCSHSNEENILTQTNLDGGEEILL